MSSNRYVRAKPLPGSRQEAREAVVRQRAMTLGVAGLVVVALVGFLVAGGGSGGDGSEQAAGPAPVADGGQVDATPASSTTSPVTASVPATPGADPTGSVPDLEGVAVDEASLEGCVIGATSLRQGESGDDVKCLQQSLSANGFYQGPVNGVFDATTNEAVQAVQVERALYVDGIVGRETALSLGIWPDEESFVTRTPEPPAGAVDLMGFPLSSVASAGDDAPPLPENSGTGRRLVYERRGQRVWAVGEDGEIIRSWLVSGSKYSNELPGTHEVYSRSEMSTAWNGQAWLPKMVRWLKTQRGALGFHAIPLHVADDSPYQTEAELGTRLSGGCQRQANADADFVWEFAQVGTPVVVL